MLSGEYKYICSFIAVYRLCLRCVPGSWLGTGDAHVTVFPSSSPRSFQFQNLAPLLTRCRRATLGKLPSAP